jgi:hypothetical protein
MNAAGARASMHPSAARASTPERTNYCEMARSEAAAGQSWRWVRDFAKAAGVPVDHAGREVARGRRNRGGVARQKRGGKGSKLVGHPVANPPSG